jgi:hypothetical protein
MVDLPSMSITNVQCLADIPLEIRCQAWNWAFLVTAAAVQCRLYEFCASGFDYIRNLAETFPEFYGLNMLMPMKTQENRPRGTLVCKGAGPDRLPRPMPLTHRTRYQGKFDCISFRIYSFGPRAQCPLRKAEKLGGRLGHGDHLFRGAVRYATHKCSLPFRSRPRVSPAGTNCTRSAVRPRRVLRR